MKIFKKEIPQEVLNKLNQYKISKQRFRRKNKQELKYFTLIHNQEINDIINELKS